MLHNLGAGCIDSLILVLESNDPIAWQITEVSILFLEKLRENSAKTANNLQDKLFGFLF